MLTVTADVDNNFDSNVDNNNNSTSNVDKKIFNYAMVKKEH